MTHRQDCISKTSHTKDGVLIEGHVYIPKLAIIDIATHKYYYVDECENCGKMTAYYSDEPVNVGEYPIIQSLGDNWL